jgi:hypothetical protein
MSYGDLQWFVMGRVLLIKDFLFAGFDMCGIPENVLLRILTESKTKRYEKQKKTNYPINFLCINALELDAFRHSEV